MTRNISACADRSTNIKISVKKSRIRETKNLSTDKDSRSDTFLERLRDLSEKKKKKQQKKRNWVIFLKVGVRVGVGARGGGEGGGRGPMRGQDLIM